jgi:hypothetical protein
MRMTISTFAGWWEESCPSATHVLLDVWLLPLRDATDVERRAAYQRCALIATAEFPSWDDATHTGYAAPLLDRLATDDSATPALAADILDKFRRTKRPSLSDDVAAPIVRCALAFLGVDRESDLRMAEVLDIVLVPDLGLVDAVLAVDALVRLAELDLPVPNVRAFENRDDLNTLIAAIAQRRPDLPDRLRRLAAQPPSDALP